MTRAKGIRPVPGVIPEAHSMTGADNPDVAVIHRAMDVLHVQLVSRTEGAHVRWYWDGHDGSFANRGWGSRDQAIAFMRTTLDEHA